MVCTRHQALEIAKQLRTELETLYGTRLVGVWLFGSATRDELTEDSDIDIAVILDEIRDRFSEHERTSDVGAQLGLEYDTLISFFFASKADFQTGRFAVHREIRAEGIHV